MTLRSEIVLECDVCLFRFDRQPDNCYKFGPFFVCEHCLTSLSRWLQFLRMEEMSSQIINSRDGFPGGVDGIECIAASIILDEANGT